jgi:hypothetical protein
MHTNLRHFYPPPILKTYVLKCHLNVIPPLSSRWPKQLLSENFPIKNSVFRIKMFVSFCVFLATAMFYVWIMNNGLHQNIATGHNKLCSGCGPSLVISGLNCGQMVARKYRHGAS